MEMMLADAAAITWRGCVETAGPDCRHVLMPPSHAGRLCAIADKLQDGTSAPGITSSAR